MRISRYVSPLLIVVLLVYILSIASMNFSAPGAIFMLALLTFAVALVILFAVAGRVIVMWIMSRLGARISIGKIVVSDKYAFIYDSDTEHGQIVGFSVVKLIPLIPTTDMDEDAKKVLLRNMESLVSLPADLEYGVIKLSTPDVQKMLQRVTAQYAALSAKAARSKNPQAYMDKLRTLEADKQRLVKSPPVVAVIYMKLYASGYTESEIKGKLDSYINQVKGIAQALQMDARELRHAELIDFLHMQAIAGALAI
jgi:hypothetical protein